MPTVEELARQELLRRIQSRQVQPIPQTMTPVKPTIRSALGNLMRDAVDASGIGGGYRQGLMKAAQGMENIGLDFTPAGFAMDVQETGQALGRGDLIDAGISALGVVPVIGDVAKKGAQTARSALRGLSPRDVPFDDRFSPRKNSAPKASGDYLSLPERERLNQAQFSYIGNPIEAETTSIIDLEGRPFITTMSDRTGAGYSLAGVNDVQFDRPTYLHGGQDFMFDNPDLVWASDPKVVNQMHAVAQELKKSTGQDPLFLPWRMAPTGGDYATMTTDVMYEYAHKNMDSDIAARIDKAIREDGINVSKKDAAGNTRSIQIIAPEWKGIKNSETAEQIATLSGDQRKMIQAILDRDGRDAGGISLGEARLAVSDPRQYNAPAGGLQNVGIVDTARGVTTSTHPTYSGGLSGQGIGRLKEDVQAYQLLPELAQFRKLNDPRNPRATDLRALQMKPYSGIITESHLRKIFSE